MPRPVPARIHALLAKDSARAVIIRRGPSRHTAVIGWDRSCDRFEIGQWLYGRIYERRCDLSPDGRHLLYFAMNGRWSARSKGSWTAISRAPYLKALAMFAKGDCWNGGGLFLSAQTYWLNGCGYERLNDDSGLSVNTSYPWHESYGGECPGVYYVRLQRDGWAMKHRAPDGTGGETTVFDKHIGGHWRLRKYAHAGIHRLVGKGCYFDEHELRNARTGENTACADWEWADVDDDRLVWASAGKLYAGRLKDDGLADTDLLHDFNGYRFERLRAPY